LGGGKAKQTQIEENKQVMTLQQLALNVLNGTRWSFQTQWEVTQRKKDRIAERFKLVWCEPESIWVAEDEAVQLENGHWSPVEYAREIDGRWFHVSELVTCDRCDEHERPCNMTRVRSGGRRQTWCMSCEEDHSFWCEGCENRYESDESHERDGILYCENCLPAEEEDIFSYHSQNRPRIPLEKQDFPFWSLELELELGSESDRSRFISELRNHSQLKQDHIILEKDGSLCSDRGVEVIFCLFEDRYELLNQVAIVQCIAKDHGGISWQLKQRRDRWAGCHINRNRGGWRERDLMRLCYLVERLRSQLITLSGRNCTSYAAYSDSYYGTRGRRLRDLTRGVQGKYSALNLSSGSRIEWRIFSGSLSIKRIAAYCDCVESLEVLAKSNLPAHLLIQNAKLILAEINNRFNK
jgi:hypothetical protein